MGPPHVARRESCIDFDFLELTLERSRARLRPRQESIRRATCQKVGVGVLWCVATCMAWFMAPHRQTGKYSTVALKSPGPQSTQTQFHLPHGSSFIKDLLSLLPSPTSPPDPSLSFIFRARIVARQLTFAALCFYLFAAPPDRLGTSCLTKSSLTRNVTGLKG
jgi:hypothetical protein